MIKIDGEKPLVYDFNKLTVEQGELTREVCEYKLLQQEAEASSVNEVLRSGGAEWLITACRYLFNIEGKSYEQGTAEIEVDKIIRKLPYSERPKLEEAVKDFFTNIGSDRTALALLQKKSDNNLMRMLLPLVMKMKSEEKSNESVSNT